MTVQQILHKICSKSRIVRSLFVKHSYSHTLLCSSPIFFGLEMAGSESSFRTKAVDEAVAHIAGSCHVSDAGQTDRDSSAGNIVEVKVHHERLAATSGVLK